MIINADSLMPYLQKKVQLVTSDSSRHFLCPQCLKRTRLNRLGDGRRKCTICGKKFRVNKITERKKLLQCAQVLFCFCLDLSPERTAQLNDLRIKRVGLYYGQFRKILMADNRLKEEKQSLSSRKRKAQTPLNPHQQAQEIIELMPKDFLTSWFGNV